MNSQHDLPPGVQVLEPFKMPARPDDATSGGECPARLKACDQDGCWKRGDQRGQSFCMRLHRARNEVQGALLWVDSF